MNEKDLMNALNEIDDDLLVFEEKKIFQKKQNFFQKKY